jgi:hypothetical protein
MIVLAPFDRRACGCIAPVSAWESKASATRTLRGNRLKSLIGWCQQIDTKSLTLARNGMGYDETRMHFVLTSRVHGGARPAPRATITATGSR